MDRENVIKDLEFCVSGHFNVELSLAKEILALLKEQEAEIRQLRLRKHIDDIRGNKMIKKYQKKPVVIEAVQWDGTDQSLGEIVNWIGHEVLNLQHNKLGIETLEGLMEASVGDFIIKGVKGEFYPCKPDIFAETYMETE